VITDHLADWGYQKFTNVAEYNTNSDSR